MLKKDFKKIIPKYFLFSFVLFFISYFPAFAVNPVQPSPIPAFNPTPGTPETINQIMLGFAMANIVKFGPVLILVALVTFLAGVVKFVSAGDNEEKRTAGRSVMVFGIVVLFVMVSLWGFVKILTQSFFGNNPTTPNYLPGLIQ